MSETTKSAMSDNAAAAIAYITFVPAIVFLMLPPYNTSPYVRFHAWQSIFLDIVSFIVILAAGMTMSMVLFFGARSFLVASRLIVLCWVLLWILCVINAINGRRIKLPLIGQLAEKQAGM